MGYLKVKVLVAQSCLTLCNPMDYSPPGSSIHGILEAGILEWIAMPFSRGIFPTQVLNPGLPNYRQILYCLSFQGSPWGYLCQLSGYKPSKLLPLYFK